jgi:hypothetical protein
MNTNFESILSSLQDELLVLIFVAKSDNRMVASERNIIVRYAEERAKDKRLDFGASAEPLMAEPLMAELLLEWVRKQKPTAAELPGLLARVKQNGADGIQALMEVTSIIAEMDEKLKPDEMHELAQLQTLIKAHI